MTLEALHSAGLLGDLGWNDADEPPMGGLKTALLVLASGAVWGSAWVLSGLPPIFLVTTRASRRRRLSTKHLPRGEGAR